MLPDPQMIAFDADDTLWHNERFFRLTQAEFAAKLADFAPPEALGAQLEATERRNLARYGFGIKGFVLSMIETAIEVTEARVPASVIAEIVALGQDMLAHPIELLPEVETTLDALSGERLMLITKGDLLHQEQKLARSGLAERFEAVEIVSDKAPSVYRDICARHRLSPEHIVMVGNSMKSDILPILDIGGWGVHVPQPMEWTLDHALAPGHHPRLFQTETLGGLLPLLPRF